MQRYCKDINIQSKKYNSLLARFFNNDLSTTTKVKYRKSRRNTMARRKYEEKVLTLQPLMWKTDENGKILCFCF